MTGRTYAGKPSRAIPIWNGVLEHCRRIGAGIWVFLWCLDAVTVEKAGRGLVYGGAPVKAAVIAKALGFDGWTVRQHLRALGRGGYLCLRRTPYGHTIEVMNSKKFGVWHAHKRSGENPHSEGKRSLVYHRESVGNATERVGGNPRNKEDAARNAAKTQQQPAAASLNLDAWLGIGLDRAIGDPAFREFWETTWASKNGHPLSVVMGNAADAWQAASGTVPGPFFARLAGIREAEKANAIQRRPGKHSTVVDDAAAAAMGVLR